MTPPFDQGRQAAAVIDATDEWAALVDHALQGIHHALNNRIGSLAALVELHQLGDLPADGTAFDAMATDVARLEDANRVVRLLGRDGVSGEEAVLPTDVLADVLAIHRFLHDLRETALTVAPTRFVEPVRVERWALVRVLTLLLAEEKQRGRDTGRSVHAVMESGDDAVRIEFRASGTSQDLVEPDLSERPHADGYADRLAAALGGSVRRLASATRLELPTLKARRASDRR